MCEDKIPAEILKIWEKSIETQMHFNDLIMRNRTIVISFITAIFGAAAYALRGEVLATLTLFGKNINVSALIIIFGIVFLLAYAILDMFYYLPLLVGAVKFTEGMDLKYKDFGLTTKINKEIKYKRAKKILLAHYIILIVGALVITLFVM